MFKNRRIWRRIWNLSQSWARDFFVYHIEFTCWKYQKSCITRVQRISSINWNGYVKFNVLHFIYMANICIHMYMYIYLYFAFIFTLNIPYDWCLEHQILSGHKKSCVRYLFSTQILDIKNFVQGSIIRKTNFLHLYTCRGTDFKGYFETSRSRQANRTSPPEFIRI